MGLFGPLGPGRRGDGVVLPEVLLELGDSGVYFCQFLYQALLGGGLLFLPGLDLGFGFFKVKIGVH